MWRVTGQGLERDRSLIRVVPLPPVPRNRHRPWPRTTQESGSRKRSQGHFHSLLAKWYHFPRGWGLSAGLSSRSCGTAALSLHRVRGWKIDTRRGSEQSATKVIVDNGIAPNDTHHDDGEREREPQVSLKCDLPPGTNYEWCNFFLSLSPDSTCWNYALADLHGNGICPVSRVLNRGNERCRSAKW